MYYYFFETGATKFFLEKIISFHTYLPQALVNTIVMAPFAFAIITALLITLSVWIHSLTISSNTKDERKEIRKAFVYSAILSVPLVLLPFPLSLLSAIAYAIILSRKLKKISAEKYSLIALFISIPMVSLFLLFISIITAGIIYLLW